MKRQNSERRICDYTTKTIYEYFEDSILDQYNDQLVGVISKDRCIYNIANKERSCETQMLEDLKEELFGIDYSDDCLDHDCIKLYSGGKSLSVEFPEEISEKQLHVLQDILKDVRQFEIDWDRAVYMPFNSREIIATAKNLVTGPAKKKALTRNSK